jgi:hypothetical protein
MTRALTAIAAALALSACASVETYNGHAMPAQCSPAALAAITVPIIEVEQIPYALRQHYDTLGLWIQRPSGNVILLKAGLPADQRARVLAHEQCHEIAGAWHG